MTISVTAERSRNSTDRGKEEKDDEDDEEEEEEEEEDSESDHNVPQADEKVAGNGGEDHKSIASDRSMLPCFISASSPLSKFEFSDSQVLHGLFGPARSSLWPIVSREAWGLVKSAAHDVKLAISQHQVAFCYLLLSICSFAFCCSKVSHFHGVVRRANQAPL